MRERKRKREFFGDFISIRKKAQKKRPQKEEETRRKK
jgi:hypothetical protein